MTTHAELRLQHNELDRETDALWAKYWELRKERHRIGKLLAPHYPDFCANCGARHFGPHIVFGAGAGAGAIASRTCSECHHSWTSPHVDPAKEQT